MDNNNNPFPKSTCPDARIREVEALNAEVKLAEEEGPVTPLQSDVLFGRDKQMFNHPGNVRFRLVIQGRAKEYESAPNRRCKSTIVYSVVQTVQSYGGRFLKRESKTAWKIVSVTEAIQKVGHALRDKKQQDIRQREREILQAHNDRKLLDRAQKVETVKRITPRNKCVEGGCDLLLKLGEVCAKEIGLSSSSSDDQSGPPKQPATSSRPKIVSSAYKRALSRKLKKNPPAKKRRTNDYAKPNESPVASSKEDSKDEEVSTEEESTEEEDSSGESSCEEEESEESYPPTFNARPFAHPRMPPPARTNNALLAEQLPSRQLEQLIRSQPNQLDALSQIQDQHQMLALVQRLAHQQELAVAQEAFASAAAAPSGGQNGSLVRQYIMPASAQRAPNVAGMNAVGMNLLASQDRARAMQTAANNAPQNAQQHNVSQGNLNHLLNPLMLQRLHNIPLAAIGAASGLSALNAQANNNNNADAAEETRPVTPPTESAVDQDEGNWLFYPIKVPNLNIGAASWRLTLTPLDSQGRPIELRSTKGGPVSGEGAY